MSEADREVAAAGPGDVRSESGAPVRLHLVAHEPDAYRLFYTVVADRVLWFVQHGLWDLKHDPTADLAHPWAEGYVAVNRGLAAAAVDELDRHPGAPLLVQDYHLYVAPALVRAVRPAGAHRHVHPHPVGRAGRMGRAAAGHRRAVHEGVLACDSIGFHTERWRAAFVESCEALLGRGDEAELRSHANPLAVDAESSPARRHRGRPRTKGGARGERTRDPRPPCRPHRPVEERGARLRGVRAPARARPVAPRTHRARRAPRPVRQEIPEYVEYRTATEAAAAAVNARFATPGWEPIRLDVRDDFLAAVAAYTDYDVLLVNPVMDGLNLVAKEAPLVTAGRSPRSLTPGRSFDEIGACAVGIDPLDVPGQADALARAIALPGRASPFARRDARDGARPRPERLGRARARASAPRRRSPDTVHGATMRA